MRFQNDRVRGSRPDSGRRRSRLRAVLAASLVFVAAADASAQLVVYDAATSARNTITATLKEDRPVQQQQHSKIREMARRLSALTNLGKYALADVPRWRTHGGDFFFAQPFNDALIFGDPTGIAFTELTHPLISASALLSRLDPRAPAAGRSPLGDRECGGCHGHCGDAWHRPVAFLWAEE